MPRPDREPSVKSSLGVVPSFVRRSLSKLLRLVPDERERGMKELGEAAVFSSSMTKKPFVHW